MSISSLSHFQIKNQEYRCPKCSLVPFIKISYDNNQLFMSTRCTNNHIYSKPFAEMQSMCKSSPISNYTCDICENEKFEKKEKLDIFYYCSDCYKFFCLKHGKIHNLKEDHKIFLNKKFDSICTKHDGTTVVGYCVIHKINYCVLCNHFNENNKKIEEELSDEKIKILEKEMEKNEKIINELDSLFNKYKKKFLELENNFLIYKNNMNKRIEFMNEIINFYKTKKIESDINYQMKANIEENYFDLSQHTQKIFNNLNMQIDKINELDKILKKKEELNE